MFTLQKYAHNLITFSTNSELQTNLISDRMTTEITPIMWESLEQIINLFA